MDQFVCVRIVQANRLDLQLFQFDYDLTFAVFFLNADRTVYGRYGSRSSHEEAESDISLEGFREAMRGALTLHEKFPSNREALAGKQPKKISQRTPDDFPSLKGKYGFNLDYSGKVARSCMHCHQIRDADRLVYREAGKPMTNQMLLPFPMPETIGLSMDPKQRASVVEITDDSPAARAGLRAGDEIVVMNGQPILSTADIQWVLHHSQDTDRWPATIRRDETLVELSVNLSNDWRRAANIDWRVSTWELRRMATGGIRLQALSRAEKSKAGIDAGNLALLAEHVGQYNAHAAAKRAGFRKGDVLVKVGEFESAMSESELLVRIMQGAKKGDKLPTVVLRGDKRIRLMLPTQ